MPSMETLERLAYATKLNPGWLGFGLPLSSIAPQIKIIPARPRRWSRIPFMLPHQSTCVSTMMSTSYVDPLESSAEHAAPATSHWKLARRCTNRGLGGISSPRPELQSNRDGMVVGYS